MKRGGGALSIKVMMTVRRRFGSPTACSSPERVIRGRRGRGCEGTPAEVDRRRQGYAGITDIRRHQQSPITPSTGVTTLLPLPSALLHYCPSQCEGGEERVNSHSIAGLSHPTPLPPPSLLPPSHTHTAIFILITNGMGGAVRVGSTAVRTVQ